MDPFEKLKIYIAMTVLSSRLTKDLFKVEINEKNVLDFFYKLSDDKKLNNVMPHIASVYSGNALDVAGKIVDRCNKKEYHILAIDDEKYPALLKEINSPPLVLYTMGKYSFSNNNRVAVVGTRNPIEKSYIHSREIALNLSSLGVTIVSGMARGVDRAAHEGALVADGSTIGVLANGFGIIYPKLNEDIIKKIMISSNSTLISEYPPGIYAGKWTFIRRNRIISGLSAGVIVVEAMEKSGAMITARYAVEQNRDVFAFPGNSFDERFSGCHKIIREGAIPVFDETDILSNLNFNLKKIIGTGETKSHGGQISSEFYSRESIEYKVLEMLCNCGTENIDNISRALKLDISHVNDAIMMLELNDDIIRNGADIKLFK